MGSNAYGQLGDGTNTTRISPVRIVDASVTTAIASGASHSLFMKKDGSLWAVGHNQHGQLGDGNFTDRSTPPFG